MFKSAISALMRLIPTFKAYWLFGKFVNVYGPFTALDASSISVGRNVAINHGVFLQGRSGIIIGDNVVLSARVMVMDGGLDVGEAGGAKSEHVAMPIEIGSGAWIGAGSIILPGVTIGKNVVIGAGSVVTRSVPAGEVWAGNPARSIRR